MLSNDRVYTQNTILIFFHFFAGYLVFYERNKNAEMTQRFAQRGKSLAQELATGLRLII